MPEIRLPILEKHLLFFNNALSRFLSGNDAMRKARDCNIKIEIEIVTAYLSKEEISLFVPTWEASNE